MRVLLRCKRCFDRGGHQTVLAVVGHWSREPDEVVVFIAKQRMSGTKPELMDRQFRRTQQRLDVNGSELPALEVLAELLVPARSTANRKTATPVAIGSPPNPFDMTFLLTETATPINKAYHSRSDWTVLKNPTIIVCQRGHKIQLGYHQALKLANNAFRGGLEEVFI